MMNEAKVLRDRYDFPVRADVRTDRVQSGTRTGRSASW